MFNSDTAARRAPVCHWVPHCTAPASQHPALSPWPDSPCLPAFIPLPHPSLQRGALCGPLPHHAALPEAVGGAAGRLLKRDGVRALGRMLWACCGRQLGHPGLVSVRLPLPHYLPLLPPILTLPTVIWAA